MSEFRLRRLESHRVGGVSDQMLLSYRAPQSPSGKVYRYSPNPEAVPRLFLIGEAPIDRVVPEALRARIRLEPGSTQTVCPYSGDIASDDDFAHFDDIQAVKSQIAWEVEADLADHLSEIASEFNRGLQSGGLISIKMEVKSTPRPRPVPIRTDLLRDLECDVCRRPYAVYAIALFCPDCGAPNLSLHFPREVALVGDEIEMAERLDSEGRQELAYRLLGNSHEDVLTAFEATLKSLYRHLVREQLPDQSGRLCAWKEIGNSFQNIDRTREKLLVLNIDPFTHLSGDELESMRVNIQKRHVIGYNLGVADDRYGELIQTEQPGETVHLMGNEIIGFAALCLRVVEMLEGHLLPGVVLAP